MEGSPRSTRIYYRCAARTIVPGSPVLATHPKNVYLPEASVTEQLNDWIGGLLTPGNRDATIRALLGTEETAVQGRNLDPVLRRLADATTRLSRLQAAIEAGANPGALIDGINRAQEEKHAAEAELRRAPVGRSFGQAEIDAMVDYLGDVGRKLHRADPKRLQEMYEEIDLEMVYNAEGRTVDVTIRPVRRVSAGVRGPS